MPSLTETQRLARDFVDSDPNIGRIWDAGVAGSKSFKRGFKGYVLKKIPVLQWLPNCITIGVLLVPQSLSYANVANIPGSYGLMSSWLPMLIYMIMGTSKYTTSGPTAIMALLTGEIVTDLTKEGYETHVIATAVAFMCGLYGVAVGFLKLGFLLDLIPVPVLSGYVSAAALTIIIQQIPSIFAETASADSVAEYIREIFQKLPTTKWRDFASTSSILPCMRPRRLDIKNQSIPITF